MSTDKEIGAFVDRIATRLNDNPKAPQRGRHRAAFIAVRPLVEGALSRGHTLKATWEALRDERKLSMSYETFRSYCRRARLGGENGRAAPDGSELTPRIPAASATRTAPPEQSDEACPRGFRHQRIPRKQDIFG
jgi:hypothetical protein